MSTTEHGPTDIVVVRPAAEPHLHRGYETAVYLVRGRVETRYASACHRRSQ